MIDVDGNEHVDYDMGFGALSAGHIQPCGGRSRQLDDGTRTTPCELSR
jgi:glutamate-1-semialdehyde aminotransferase